MASSEFSIPDLPYFRAKNIFSGSLQGFQYKIWPRDGGLTAAVWNGPFCFEQTQDTVTQSFPMDADGREQLLCWLSEQKAALGRAE